MSTRGYRTADSYLSQTAEKREQQLANLVRGRMMRGREAEQGAPSFKKEEYKIDPILFIEEQFFVVETKRPIVLTDWQKEKVFKPLFYVDKRPTMALYGACKKSGKSTISAAIASWFLFKGEENGELYLCASDKEQASWITFNKLVKAIEYNKQMLIRCKITSDSIEIPHKRTVLRSIPTDASISGVNPNFVHFDELYLYRYEGMREFWEALTTVPTRKNPLTLITTTAGWDEDTLLFELYRKGQKGEDPTFYFIWDQKNRMPWQTKAYLKQQRGRLRPNSYLRLHENRWTSSESSFIPMSEWDGCVDRTHKPLIPGVIPSPPLYCSIDIGTKHDSSAVVGVYRDKNMVKLALAQSWIPSKKNPLDIDETVGRYLRSVNKDFNLKVVYFDPWQCHQLATELKKEGIKVQEFNQTTDKLTQMGQNLYNLIMGGNLLLYPHKEMRNEAQKTLAKESQRGFRIVKKKASERIDLIISLAMSCQGCIEKAQPRPGRVYVDSSVPLMDHERDALNAKREKGKGHVYIA